MLTCFVSIAAWPEIRASEGLIMYTSVSSGGVLVELRSTYEDFI